MRLRAADPLRLAATVAEIADDEGAATVVHDDEQGIYGHPDHRATFRIGATAAELVGATRVPDDGGPRAPARQRP